MTQTTTENERWNSPRSTTARALPAGYPQSTLLPSRLSRIFHRILGRCWIHLLLLSLIGLFLFPFAYMVATSLKTDEELTETDWLPAIPQFQPQSPRIRPAEAIVKPAEATQERWDAALPELRRITRAAVDATALPKGAESVNADNYRAATTEFLLTRLIPRMNADLWSGNLPAIVEAYQSGLTPAVIADALDNRLARFELRGLQLRTLDGVVHTITAGKDIASTWKIESSHAQFVEAKNSAIVKYWFDSGSSSPISLSCAFDFPADPSQLHKLILAIKPDDSWHKVTATLELGGLRWYSQKIKYLGTTRNQSLIFQPPSFDDTTDRQRIWVPLRAGSGSPTSDPRRAVLRINITPSSTAGAIWGKVRQNYDRVFESIPFWRYVGNSLMVVILATLGTLFSSTFVAYAFARLHWPGRTVAFAILLSTMMLPAQVTMIPSFLVWKSANLYNTLCPLWLPAWFGTAFFIFLMTQHMRTLPRELEEAARIDGAGVLRTWAQIILPETRPALAAIAIMVFMASWNDFMTPLVYLRDQSKFPLSLGLYGLRLDAPEGGIDWTRIMAGNVMMTAPVVFVFFLFQRYFIQGMTMSGMKG